MRVTKFIVIVFGVIIIGYMFYLFVGMSSTYPPLKDYRFKVSKEVFAQKLARRILNSHGWTLERRDSVKIKAREDCFWISLSYKRNQEHLEYSLKYCIDNHDLIEDDGCLTLYVVSIVDYVKQRSYYRSGEEVEHVLQILDRTVLDGLVPACSEK
jgi:hypothetical protein